MDPPLTTVHVNRDETPVMFRRVADDHEAIGRAWVRLEATLGSLRGRKLFGVFDSAAGEYRVCAQIREGDDAGALGFEVGTLPGGAYLRARLRGKPPAVYEVIPSIFDELDRRTRRDEGRPVIEFYRRRDTIDLLLPVS